MNEHAPIPEEFLHPKETEIKKWGEYVEDPDKTYYHGSSDDFELDPDMTKSVFGGELYVTDHKDTAGKFAVGQNSKIHEVNLRLKKVFEFDKEISIEEANRIFEQAGFKPLEAWEWNRTGWPFISMGVLDGKLHAEVSKDLSDEDRKGEVINKKVNDILRKLGYDAVRSPQAKGGENAWRLLHKGAFVQKKS